MNANNLISHLEHLEARIERKRDELAADELRLTAGRAVLARLIEERGPLTTYAAEGDGLAVWFVRDGEVTWEPATTARGVIVGDPQSLIDAELAAIRESQPVALEPTGADDWVRPHKTVHPIGHLAVPAEPEPVPFLVGEGA